MSLLMITLSVRTITGHIRIQGFIDRIPEFDGGERQRIAFDRCQFIKNTWSPAYDVPGAIIDVAHGHDDIVINECLIVGNSIGVPEDTIAVQQYWFAGLPYPTPFRLVSSVSTISQLLSSRTLASFPMNSREPPTYDSIEKKT